jgi:copper chaperone CopZ
MSCACETKIVGKRLKSLKGVESFSINPISNWLKVPYDAALVSTDDIKKSIAKTGMTASLLNVKK